MKRWRTTKRKIREFLKYKFKKWDVPLSAIKYAHANDFLHFLLTKQGIEENTASKYLKNTRELLQIAEDQEWITKNPWNNYKNQICSAGTRMFDYAGNFDSLSKTFVGTA